MIDLFDNPESVSRAAADLFVREARAAVSARGRFSVALSGGQTPQRTYRRLAGAPWRDLAPWPDIHVFWGDERWVAADDARNNARMAFQTLLQHVPVNAAHVHPIHCEGDPEAGAARYDELLRTQLPAAAAALDFVFLGLGQNGHTASLFPYTPVLTEKSRWAAHVYVDEQRMFRVTLTPAMINAARVVVFLVTGRDKAQVLKDVLQGPTDTRRLPAQLIQPSPGRLIWMVDQAAASELAPGPGKLGAEK